MLSFEQPIAKRPPRAEQPVKQEYQPVSKDGSPEILAAEVDADLEERIRAVAQDEISDRKLKDPTIAQYHRLAQQFRKELKKVGLTEADKASSEQLLETYGGPEGYSNAVAEASWQEREKMKVEEKAEAKKIEKERQADLARIAEIAEHQEDPEEVRDRLAREVMEKVVETTEEEGGEQYIPPEDAGIFAGRHVDARLEKVPPPVKADPEAVFEAFQAMQKQEQDARDLAARVEKSKKAGVGQGMVAEARIAGQQEKSSNIAYVLEGVLVKPAVAEGLFETGKRTADNRAERGGMFSLEDLMKKYPE